MGNIFNGKMIVKRAINIDFECENETHYWCFNVENCIYLTGRLDSNKKNDYWSSFQPMKIHKDEIQFFSCSDGDWLPAEDFIQNAYKAHLTETGLLR